MIFRGPLEAAGLRVSGQGEAGEVRVVELPTHRFFLATLFLPQLSSASDRPHPVIVAYLRAVCAYRDEREPTPSRACTNQSPASEVHE